MIYLRWKEEEPNHYTTTYAGVEYCAMLNAKGTWSAFIRGNRNWEAKSLGFFETPAKAKDTIRKYLELEYKTTLVSETDWHPGTSEYYIP